MEVILLVSVCRTDTCTERGSDDLYFEFLRQLKAQGLEDKVKIQRGGCYGLCKIGPNVIIREGNAALAVLNDMFGSDCDYRGLPGEYHYADLKVDEVARVVAEHLGQGRPVEEFMGRDPRVQSA